MGWLTCFILILHVIFILHLNLSLPSSSPFSSSTFSTSSSLSSHYITSLPSSSPPIITIPNHPLPSSPIITTSVTTTPNHPLSSTPSFNPTPREPPPSSDSPYTPSPVGFPAPLVPSRSPSIMTYNGGEGYYRKCYSEGLHKWLPLMCLLTTSPLFPKVG